MSTREKLHSRYLAEAQILDACLRVGGGSYTAPTYAKAVVFRQRCHTFMKKFRDAAETSSPYDVLTIRALPAKSIVPDLEAPITVRIDTRRAEGLFVPDEGPAEAEVEDTLLNVAEELRKSLGL